MDATELAVLSRLGGSPGGAGPQSIPTAQRAAFGLPSLNTTSITDSAGNTNTLANTCTVLDWATPYFTKTRLIFGRLQADGTLLYPTLPVTDDGSSGSGFLKLMTFPKGKVAIHPCYANLPVSIGVVGGNWTMTTAVMAVGSAQAGTDASLTSTEQDIIEAKSLKALTYTANARVIGSAVSGAKTAAVTALFTGTAPQTIPALLDSSGGTAAGSTLASGTIAASAGTIASITVAGTIPAGIVTQNAISTLAAQLEIVRARVEGMPSKLFDGTSTALSFYLNFAVNSDPTAAQTIKLGFIAAGSEQLHPAGYIDFFHSYLGSDDGTSIYEIAPPKHGGGVG